MKKRKLFYTAMLPLLLLLFCSQQHSYAEITGISNSLITSSFNSGARIPIFKSKTNVIRVSGPWLDITNSIVAEGLNGQTDFNIAVGNKRGPNDPYVEFTINANKTGSFRVKLKRLGGEDVVTIEFTDHISINDAQALTISNSTPAYLDAFSINTDIRLRITGTNVDKVSFKPTAVNYTITNATIGSATTTQKDVGFQYSRARDKVEISQSDFVFTAAGKEYKYSQYKGNGAWNTSNLPFFRTYDKPDFIVMDVVSGIYNRKTGACGAINQFNNFMIENPSRCVTEFNIANPTPENPQVEKIVTLPDVKFTIKNDSYAPQFTPITVQIKFGLNILQTITIPRMIAQQQTVIVFVRAEKRKKFVRNLNCAECFELNEAPFNWLDNNYTVVIDPGGVIPEDSDLNNSKTFTGSATIQ